MKAFKWLKKKSLRKYEQVPALRDEEDMCLSARVTFSVHCRNCANDVRKCCKDMEGVETAELDEENKVIVKGRFGREELAKRLFRRVHRLVEIQSLEMEGIPGQENDETTPMGKIMFKQTCKEAKKMTTLKNLRRFKLTQTKLTG